MEKGNELVPMCDFAISKNESKRAKGEEKSKQQKIGTSKTTKIFLRTLIHGGHTCNIPPRDVRIEDDGTTKHCTNTTITTKEHHTERREKERKKK